MRKAKGFAYGPGGQASTEIAATHLGVSVRQVQKLCAEGRLGTKVGRDWIITWRELTAFNQVERRPGRPREKGADK